MRVRHISVTGLFGVYDHEIPLQKEGRITIIHGLNGTGKTTVLRMIHAALTGKYDTLRAIPYEHFEIRFDDGSKLESEHTNDGSWDDDDPREYHPMVTFVAPDGGEDSDDFLSTNTPSVRLMTIDRLFKIETTYTSDDDDKGLSRLTPSVEECPNKMSRLMEEKRSEFTDVAQELAQTFPTRILTKNGSAPLSPEELRRRLSALHERTEKLSSLGLVPPPEDPISDVPEETDRSTLSALSVYVRDTEKRLAVFDDMVAKIELLAQLVNDRFRQKRFAIHRDRGFVLTTPDGRALPVSKLSSGEQNELIMLYDLLFETEPDTLVLIDEPELSLHLVWQQEFLNDLEKIVGLTDVDVLLATHSSDIIDKHWDWTVALEERRA